MEKRYLGPAEGERRWAEYWALTRLQGRFPVPGVLSSPGDEVLRVRFVPGRHGQDALTANDADHVLRLCGETLAVLHSFEPLQLGYASADGRQRLVHGDFGPQNVLISMDGQAVAAVIDWEFSHLGDPLEDLAMAEWIVRTHHPELTDRLPAFYQGYGRLPDWGARKRMMIQLCRKLRDFCGEWGDPDAVAMWDRRIEETEKFRQ